MTVGEYEMDGVPVALFAMNIQETHQRARSLLTLGRSCKPSLPRGRFRMQPAVMHDFKGLAILTVAKVVKGEVETRWSSALRHDKSHVKASRLWFLSKSPATAVEVGSHGDCLGNSCSVGSLAQVSCTHATSSVEARLSCRSACGHNANAPPSACRHSTSAPLPGGSRRCFSKVCQRLRDRERSCLDNFNILPANQKAIKFQNSQFIVPDSYQVCFSGRQPPLNKTIRSKVSAV